MTRFSPYLAELQPAMFVEVHPDLARERGLEHGGWATIVTAALGDRGARARHRPDAAGADRRPRRSTRSGCRTTGARAGSRPAASANDLTHMALDPNVHIQEVKALTCDIRPGRRPRGAALPGFVAELRERGGTAPR